MIEEPNISSHRLGIDAYAKARGAAPRRRAAQGATGAKTRAQAAAAGSSENTRSARELKAQVLKTLQGQSNSGMVNIRDVASALDALLKRP